MNEQNMNSNWANGPLMYLHVSETAFAVSNQNFKNKQNSDFGLHRSQAYLVHLPEWLTPVFVKFPCAFQMYFPLELFY